MGTESEGFWTKAKRSVKGFFKGALESLPMTLLFTGGALALSAGANAAFGIDPLSVAGNDASKIAIRLVGGALIGSTLNGALSGYRAYNAPEEETPVAPGGRSPSMGGRERENEVSHSGFVPSYTPSTSRSGDRGVRATSVT
jgi:hypothetical protein